MTLEHFIEKVKNSPNTLDFNELMEVIDGNYTFSETAFVNGDEKNQAGQNSGSCKLFAFAKLQNLSKEETLACFGQYYRDDVLANPDGDDHQNIRNFMRAGWEGIHFETEALISVKP